MPCPDSLTACPYSSLEMTCYDSDEANPRSVSSLSNRSSPLSWRYGQSSPRLQAGDAPSVGGTCRSEGTPSWYTHGERAHYSHTMPMRSPSKLSHISRLELVEALDSDDVELKSGYMSDSDLMGKTLTEDDDITTGYVPVRGSCPDRGSPGVSPAPVLLTVGVDGVEHGLQPVCLGLDRVLTSQEMCPC